MVSTYDSSNQRKESQIRMRACWFLNLASEACLCELTAVQRQVHTTQTATLLIFTVAAWRHLLLPCPSSDWRVKLSERRGRTNQKQQPLLPCTLVRELLIPTGFFGWFCLFPLSLQAFSTFPFLTELPLRATCLCTRFTWAHQLLLPLPGELCILEASPSVSTIFSEHCSLGVPKVRISRRAQLSL